jgi:cytoskeletal protein CcmA (bactofilin family)
MGLFGRDDRSPHDERTTTPARAPQPPSGRAAHTIIGSDNRLEGTVYGAGDVHVEGKIEGAVDTSGNVLVLEIGTVSGSVSARAVTVSGTVTGDVSASERIELKPSARVEGNMTAARILINDGATFDGQVFMREPQPRPGQSKKQAEIVTSSARRAEASKGEDKDQPAADAASTPAANPPDAAEKKDSKSS